jgi:hypothetical protein
LKKKAIIPKKKTGLGGVKKLSVTSDNPKDAVKIESFDHMEKRTAREAAEKEDYQVTYIHRPLPTDLISLLIYIYL